MSLEAALVVTGIILVLDFFMILYTYGYKHAATRRSRKRREAEERIEKLLVTEGTDFRSLDHTMLLNIYMRLRDTFQLSAESEEKFRKYLITSPVVKRNLRRLTDDSWLKRSEAAHRLKYIESAPVRKALLAALEREQHPVTILYLSHALAVQGVTKAIGPIVSKLKWIDPWFAERIRAVLYTFGKDFLRYAKYRTRSNRIYMQQLLCGFAVDYPAEELREYLIEKAFSRHESVRTPALQALLNHFPESFMKEPFASTAHRQVLRYVLKAYGSTLDPQYIPRILAFAGHKFLHKEIVESLSDMASHNPAVLSTILSLFRSGRSKEDRSLLAQVLGNRVEYYLTRINSPIEGQVKEIIRELVRARQTSSIFTFLNRNRDSAIEAKVIEALKPAAARSKVLRNDMRVYLDSRILEAFHLRSENAPLYPPSPHNEPPQRLKLVVILVSALLFFPAVILAWEFSALGDMDWMEVLKLFVVRFNYLLVFYALTLNGIYLTMLSLSAYAARRQQRLWMIKDSRLLNTKNLLPSVSIIAPAYNEQENIVQSTNSLLSQEYPDFELIVINDGSKDETLNTLISYFELEKKDMIVTSRVQTMGLKGIYTNKNIPNLIVVDKVNGGKADTLNMGLNISSKEFFCGIDADSLLEPQALLRAISVMLDSPEESIAAGGNICPVNGCTVDHGSLEHISLPEKLLPRLQSLEYIRSFMSGRVGWAFINSLLIISGAFGIFDRKLTIRSGGYMTKSGKYHRDTVGEDMELVVRLSRYMRELKRPYSVDYAVFANCWTEVPEAWRSLYRQRDRWHRGLVDIMLFHRKLVANPRYGRLGVVAMPYFFIFEFIGPFFEAQGLIMVIIALVIGVMNVPIALLLFSTTILLGILVSVSSVHIAELEVNIYSPRDVSRLLRMALLENFGLRHMISLWRISGYISAMKRSKGWGAQSRRGFKPSTAPKE